MCHFVILIPTHESLDEKFDLALLSTPIIRISREKLHVPRPFCSLALKKVFKDIKGEGVVSNNLFKKGTPKWA